MFKLVQHRERFVFAGCLIVIFFWQPHGTLIDTLNWSPETIRIVPLLFSAEDSTILAFINSREKTFTKGVVNDKQLIVVFDKLIYYTLLEKCRNNLVASQIYFDQANQIGLFFLDTFNDHLLLRAIDFYKQMRNVDIKSKVLADNLYYRGCELLQQRKLNEGGNYLRIGHQLYSKVYDTRKMIDISFDLANTALQQNDYKMCDSVAVQALNVALREKYDWQIRRLRLLIGENHLALCNYDQAKIELENALSLAKVYRDTLLLSRGYERLGVTFWRRGEFSKALESVEYSYHLSQQNHNQRAKLNCLILLGMINQELGKYAEAEQYYKNAYELNLLLLQPHLNSVIATDWAFLYIELGDWEQALELQEKAIHYELRETGPLVRYLATYYSNLGLIYWNLGNQKKALEYQSLALQELKKNHSAISEETLTHLRMGYSYSKLGQKEEAKLCFQKALALSESTGETTNQIFCLLGLGDFYRDKEDFEQTLTLQQRALQLARETKSPELEWNSAIELGKTYSRLKKFELAEQTYECALRLVEKSRTKISTDILKMSFFAAKQEVYDRIVSLQWNTKYDTSAALLYSERSRARMILDMMNGYSNRATISDTTIFTAAHFQVAMRTENAVFVEYKILPDKIIVWVINNNKLYAANIDVSFLELSSLIQDFLNSIGANNFEIFKLQYAKDPANLFNQSLLKGESLYTILIRPIEKYLSPQKTVYIIPDDLLYYLPFAALSISGTFLLEKYKIAYMPSLAAYIHLLKINNPNSVARHAPRVLVVGNPTGDLDAAENEAKSIASLFEETQLIIRAQAEKSVIEAHLQNGFNYFHFAGHCIINSKAPMQSALLLAKKVAKKTLSTFDAKDNEIANNDRLTVEDLLNRQMEHIELVTLSACETALGRFLKGEGMMGFTHALLGSGISTLVSSLWKINDNNSAELMKNFYQHLATGRCTKLEALRKAQLNKIAWCRNDKVIKYPFPYFWASFILSGKGD